MRSILAKLATARRMGVAWCFFCKGQALLFSILRAVYRFDPWHAANPAGCRPYKRHVAEVANSLNPCSVMEVGCGLGEILVQIRARRRIGVDPERGVLRAARLLHPASGVHWMHGDLLLLQSISGPIDLLLAIGWVHGVSPQELERLIVPHAHRIKYILVDAFNSDESPYPFKHDFAFLERMAERIHVSTPVDDPVRRYMVFQVNVQALEDRARQCVSSATGS